METILWVVLAVATGAIGAALGIAQQRKKIAAAMGSAEETAKQIIDKARREASDVEKEADIKAKKRLIDMRLEFENETRDRGVELGKKEKRIEQREEQIDKKMSSLDSRESEVARRFQSVEQRENAIKGKEEEAERLVTEGIRRLEKVAAMSQDDAKTELLKLVESETRHESAKLIKQIEEETKENAEKKAKHIIATAIGRYAGEYVAERTVSVVNLPSEDMKGRIIGREGRNIRAIEAATGVDLIVDDTPEAVVISCFNPVRREIARQTLEQLMADGRIHPARIEEIARKVEKDIDRSIKEKGEQASFDLGLHGIHPELLKLVGMLQFRYSYSQNQYTHSIEVAFICGMIAAELGVNIKTAKRAGLLHDIGKAMDHEIEGSHAIIGAEMAKKYGEAQKVWHAIGAHHEDYKPESIYDIIVQASDGLSGARPGARREMLETYVHRVEELERISNSFKGVDRSYAIQAGRELRIIVESNKVSDDETAVMSRDIAKKIESEMTYPGQIKVTVIRETRAVNYAK